VPPTCRRTYTFRTNVDLSAFDLSTVSIRRTSGADDDVLDVLVNGKSTG